MKVSKIMGRKQSIDATMRLIEKINNRYGEELEEVDPLSALGAGLRFVPGLLKAWRSKDFIVQLFQHPKETHKRITVCRAAIGGEGGFADGISWDQLQRIKNEIGFKDCWAVECFPPETDVVNIASLRHLFLLPEAPEYGWKPLKTPISGASPSAGAQGEGSSEP